MTKNPITGFNPIPKKTGVYYLYKGNPVARAYVKRRIEMAETMSDISDLSFNGDAELGELCYKKLFKPLPSYPSQDNKFKVARKRQLFMKKSDLSRILSSIILGGSIVLGSYLIARSNRYMIISDEFFIDTFTKEIYLRDSPFLPSPFGKIGDNNNF